MPRAARKELLHPFYLLLKQVQTTGKSLTITSGNCIELGLRPAMSSNIASLRQAKKAYQYEDPSLFAFPTKITQLKDGIRIEPRISTPYSIKREAIQKKKDHLFLTLSGDTISPLVFQAFITIFEQGQVKGHVLIKNPSDRLTEIAKNKILEKSQIDFGEEGGINLRSKE